ncbi:MAG TPA: cell division protein CrgA, partial [Acidimicrobiales bacterium]|nr:cell division protein CrgA [Acidimicrobiales bacterium]
MAQRKASDRRTTPGGAGGRPPQSGRVTPKKTTEAPKVDAGVASGRYTPPIPREQKVSPRWVPVLMFVLLGLGVLVIVLNYLNLLPGDTSNTYLLI